MFSSIKSFLNNERVRAILSQVFLVVFVALSALWLFNNTLSNMEARGISAGFGFLSSTAGFGILFSPFTDFNPSVSTYLDTFWIGIGNTLLVTVMGVISSTLVGLLVGISRLSTNWLISRLALTYIEVFRNIPLLLQIMFWYFAILVPTLPNFENSMLFLNESIVLNSSGMYFPEPVNQGAGLFWIIILVLIVASAIFHRHTVKKQKETGVQIPFWRITVIAWIVALVLLSMVLQPYQFVDAVKSRFGYEGGWVIIPELAALWFALTIYTSAFIAEIVRAGIESVPKGQTEAAKSLGLKNSLTLRMIIIPQALRLIIPPQTSQYLNLAKNSSLATAIGYPDLVALFAGTVLNQVGRAVEIISMTMLVYLTISLSISMLMNWYNKKMALIER